MVDCAGKTVEGRKSEEESTLTLRCIISEEKTGPYYNLSQYGSEALHTLFSYYNYSF